MGAKAWLYTITTLGNCFVADCYFVYFGVIMFRIVANRVHPVLGRKNTDATFVNIFSFLSFWKNTRETM